LTALQAVEPEKAGLDPYSLTILPDGRMRFEIDGGNGAADLWAPVSLGQLIHVAATLDDATGSMKLYQNGSLVAQQIPTIRPFRDLDPTLHPGIGIQVHADRLTARQLDHRHGQH